MLMEQEKVWWIRGYRKISKQFVFAATEQCTEMHDMTSAEALQMANQLAVLGTFPQVETWVGEKLFQVVYPAGLDISPIPAPEQ